MLALVGFAAAALTFTPSTTLCSEGDCEKGTTMGCEIGGVDDFDKLTDADVADVRGALNKYKVIFFKGVAHKLTPESQLRFAERFGTVLPTVSKVPEYVEKGVHQSAHSVRGNETGNVHSAATGTKATVSINTMVEANKAGNKKWKGQDMPTKVARLVREPGDPFAFGEGYHADVTFFESPPIFTFLLARELPGGEDDTFFLDAARAYDTLPANLRDEILGMQAVHNDSAGMANVHPLIRTHPESGVRVVYGNSHFTRKVVGYPEAEGKLLLDKVFDHVESMPIYKFKWTCDCGPACESCLHALMWDNRQLQHTATTAWAQNPQFSSKRRELHRVTISDPTQTRPFFFPAGLTKAGMEQSGGKAEL